MTERRKTLKPACMALLLAGAFCPPQGLAQDGKGEVLDLLAQEHHVYSASRYAQTLSETPANVTVLSKGEIRHFGYRTIHEALAALPGLYDAASQWPALGVRGLAVPGDFGSRILYLVNGMPVYEPTYGSFFIETIDIDSIDRIEFVKGAGSALYGSGAVLAVVNLITRIGRDSGKSVSLEAGSGGSRKVHGAWGGSGDGGTDMFFSASATRSSGRDIYLREFDATAFDQARFGGVSAGNDSMRNARLFARIAHDDAWLQAMLVTADKRDPLASYGSVFNGRLMLHEQLGALEAGASREIGDGAKVTGRAYLIQANEKGDYPYTFSGARIPPADYINVTDLGSRQAGAELRYDRYLPNGHHLLAGVEVKRINSIQQAGDQPTPVRSGVLSVNTRPSYGQWAMFLQDEIRLGAGTLFLGARHDAYQGFSQGVKSRVSPRIAYVHEISPSTTAKLIFGEAYRAPTIYESRYQDGQPAASTLWANPLLRPELSRSIEALLEHRSHPGVTWRGSAFLHRLKDSPVLVLTPSFNGFSCLLGPEACNQYRNSGATQKVAGIEGDVRIRQADRSHLYLSAAIQNSRQDGEDLASSPRYQVKSGYATTLPWEEIDAALEAHVVGSASGRREAGGRTARTPAYLLLNAALGTGHAVGKWRTSLRVNNLLDRKIYTVASRELQPLERVPAPGRNVSLRMQLDF